MRQRRIGSADFVETVADGGVVFESPTAGYAGSGDMLRLEFPFELGRLPALAVELSDRIATMGTETVAFVSIPFSTSKPVLVVVPEVVATRNVAGPRLVPEQPRAYSINASRSPKEWCDSVATAVERIRAGRLSKVVLARQLIVEADGEIDVASVFANLGTSFASAYRFAIDGFVGASPELLIERDGVDIRSLPLAGTRSHSGDSRSDSTAHDELRASHKDHDEHSYLRDGVDTALRPYCSSLDIDASPGVLSAGNVQHLATRVSGRLSDTSTSVLDLVAALQPTPAVGGAPTREALQLIERLEDIDRGRYAGAVGWMNGSGDGCFAVAIRSAQIEGNKALLYAGNGIVADSTPERELTETQWKFQAMLNAVVRL